MPQRSMTLRAMRLMVLVTAWLLTPLGEPAVADLSASGPSVDYRPPVDGEVLRSFEPPNEPWTRGHRGVDLAGVVNGPVAAAAPGVVRFAGLVAGERWVSLAHADGVVTSYGPLGDVLVATGDPVAAGQTIGTLAPGHGPDGGSLHWGARREGAYIDPLDLIGAVRWRPALVGPSETRVGGIPELERYGPWRGRRAGIGGMLGMVDGSPLVDPKGAGYVLPPNPNHVIGVAGLGSRTDRLPIILTQLGYAAEDTTYLSYAGRTERVGAPHDPHRDQARYGPTETYLGVHAAAERLADQLRAQWSRSPGQAVDLIGHSMGGVVITYYLTNLHDPADPTLPPIAHVVTLGSPLDGADLADAGHVAARNPLVLGAIVGGGRLLGHPAPRPDDQAAADLRLGSAIVDAVHDGWTSAQADRYGGPLATGTRVLTFGGSRDLVVPDHRAALPDNPHVVLPGGHDRMRRTEASRVAVRAFLADDPVPGSTGGLGHHLTRVSGYGQRMAGEVLGGWGDPAASYAWPVSTGWRWLRGDR